MWVGDVMLLIALAVGVCFLVLIALALVKYLRS